MHQDQDAHRGRLIASVAATVISLACGTNVSNHLHNSASSQKNYPHISLYPEMNSEMNSIR
jgi:hypothetical protein